MTSGLMHRAQLTDFGRRTRELEQMSKTELLCLIVKRVGGTQWMSRVHKRYTKQQLVQCLSQIESPLYGLDGNLPEQTRR